MGKSDFVLKVTATLANARVKLVPFEERHIPSFIALSAAHPELWAHMPAGPFPTESSFLAAFRSPMFASPSVLTYAVIDKTRPGNGTDDDPEGPLAGTMSYMHSDAVQRQTEIGIIVVLPPFQRTHVTTQSVGLLLEHAFRPQAEGGLGLLKVVWQTSTANAGSLRVADRFGFRREALRRWDKLFADGRKKHKEGNGAARMPPGTGPDDLWRDTVQLAICWDDWEDGARETTKALMERKK